MKSRRIVVVCLTLTGGLLLMATLASFPVLLATGPPPTSTPQGALQAPSTYPLDLTSQPASQQAGANQMYLGAKESSSSSVPPVVVTNNDTSWHRVIREDLEGTFPPPGWALHDFSSTDGGEYFWGQRDCKALSGGYSLWAGAGGLDGSSLTCGETYANNLFTWLIFGPLDLAQATDAELQFDLWADVEGDMGDLVDVIFWGASINGGDSFDGWALAGQTGDWVPEELDLSNVPGLGNLTGQPEVYIAWVFRSNGNNPVAYDGAFVDNVAVWTYTNPPPTPPPMPLTLPITRHTTLADFAGGRSHDGTIVAVDQGDGALALAAQANSPGTWERLPSLPARLVSFAAVAAKGHLFVIGGLSYETAYQHHVYSAPIQDDGLLGRWVEVAQLPQALRAHAAVVANDHVFVLGGLNNYGLQSTVFSARINDDGTLDSWSTLPNLPVPLSVHAAVSAHGYIYVLGGRTAIDPALVSDAIYRARVGAHGTLGEWETLPTRLPLPSQWHVAVAACNHLYLIGGADTTSERSHIFRAPIQADGSLGAWSPTNPLPKTLITHAAVAARGGILVTGGWSSGDPVFVSQKQVYWAPLNQDCSLGDWLEASPLPYATDTHVLVATDRNVYNLGGTNAENHFFASVLMAPLHLDDSPMRQGTFNHQFHLGRSQTIESLRWTEEGSGDTQISVRYRVEDPATGAYGPWSDYTSTSPIPVNAIGGYLEYQLKFEAGSGPSEKRVTEVSLSINELPSVYLPIVVKD